MNLWHFSGLLAVLCLTACMPSLCFGEEPIPLEGAATTAAAHPADPKQWVVYDGSSATGSASKHIVLVTGDEEYRSEEGMPQLARILAFRHGFKCTVLFALDDQGVINPDQSDNIPGLEALAGADLMIIFTRFRDLPDKQMKHIVDYVESGRPILGLRTATHAFNIPKGKTYSRYSFNSSEWKQGFGRQVLGETWINHHGHHGRESTRGIPSPGSEAHPILRGVKDVWGPTDVYGVRLPLPGDTLPLLLGQVLDGMTPESKPVKGKKNDPMMPVAWSRSYKTPSGKVARVFATTMGASQDLQSAGLRRLLVNACYWCLGLEYKIKADSSVDIVGTYQPTSFGFGTFKKGVRPQDHAWPPPTETRPKSKTPPKSQP